MSVLTLKLDIPEEMKRQAEAKGLLTSEAVIKLIAKELSLDTSEYLAELQEEAKWEEVFDKASDVLDQWAEEALAEHRAGKTIAVDRKDR